MAFPEVFHHENRLYIFLLNQNNKTRIQITPATKQWHMHLSWVTFLFLGISVFCFVVGCALVPCLVTAALVIAGIISSSRVFVMPFIALHRPSVPTASLRSAPPPPEILTHAARTFGFVEVAEACARAD
jgi:hypothetical protein